MAHNLLDRDVRWAEGGLEIGGEPLRFFHFTGFDAARPERLTRHPIVGAWRGLEGHPGVARLREEYLSELRAAGLEEAWTTPPYGAALPSGFAVGPVMRRAYRAGLLDSERDGSSPPPNPLRDGDEERFLAWLRAPAPVSRYLRALLEQRADLRVAFPHVPGASEQAFLAWVERELADQDVSWPLVRG